MESFSYKINESDLDLNNSDSYDGYELNIPLIKENYNSVFELF